MVGIYQQNNITFSNLLAQGVTFLWQSGCVDDGSGDIFGCANTGWDCDLRQDGLDFVRNEDIFDE